MIQVTRSSLSRAATSTLTQSVRTKLPLSYLSETNPLSPIFNISHSLHKAVKPSSINLHFSRSYCHFYRSGNMVNTSSPHASNGVLSNGKEELNGNHSKVLNRWKHSYSISDKELSNDDPDVYQIMLNEKKRQRYEIELIASENFASRAVLQVRWQNIFLFIVAGELLRGLI